VVAEFWKVAQVVNSGIKKTGPNGMLFRGTVILRIYKSTVDPSTLLGRHYCLCDFKGPQPRLPTMAYHDAPEAVPDSTSPEVVPPQKVLINSPVVPQEPHLSHEADSNAPYASSSEAIYEKRGQSNRICYLPTTAFYIIITFLLLLIGGGIGGGIASAVTKNNGPSNSQR
jgi:hypothetical protein